MNSQEPIIIEARGFVFEDDKEPIYENIELGIYWSDLEEFFFLIEPHYYEAALQSGKLDYDMGNFNFFEQYLLEGPLNSVEIKKITDVVFSDFTSSELMSVPFLAHLVPTAAEFCLCCDGFPTYMAWEDNAFNKIYLYPQLPFKGPTLPKNQIAALTFFGIIAGLITER